MAYERHLPIVELIESGDVAGGKAFLAQHMDEAAQRIIHQMKLAARGCQLSIALRALRLPRTAARPYGAVSARGRCRPARRASFRATVARLPMPGRGRTGQDRISRLRVAQFYC